MYLYVMWKVQWELCKLSELSLLGNEVQHLSEVQFSEFKEKNLQVIA